MPDRINQLLQFLEEDPNDPFTLYALALEYQKSDTIQARTTFEQLTQQHPDYLPTYYAAAHFMMETGDQHQAEVLFLKGIDLAKAHSNKKALMELQSAYGIWQMDQE